MNGHRFFIKGIPKALWKEFKLACVYYDMTAKDHLISCMQDLVIRYHRTLHDAQAGPIYKHSKEKKK